MSFCLGIKVKEGLIAIADTRLISGTERITARKVTVHKHGKSSLFLMTSGLRSVRDKALTYFEEVLERDQGATRLYKVVNAFADQIRRVAEEDKKSLQDGGLNFDLHTLVGGQLADDADPKLYMIYPQGNWVELGDSTPFYIIGESGYGKPVLERTIQYNSDLAYALQVGFLAFNATITCAINVDYPIDVLILKAGTDEIVEQRFEKDDLYELSKKWQSLIRESVNQLPSEWMEKVMSRLPTAKVKATVPPPDVV
jgi:putative proteasome-type protease